jgi:hypothetical protein
MGDLHREQQRDSGGDSHYGHKLAHRLDAQVAPVEHQQCQEIVDHPRTAACACRSISVSVPSRISNTRSA